MNCGNSCRGSTKLKKREGKLPLFENTRVGIQYIILSRLHPKFSTCTLYYCISTEVK